MEAATSWGRGPSPSLRAAPTCLLLVQQRQLLLRAHVLELGVDEALPQHLVLRQQPLHLVCAWCVRGMRMACARGQCVHGVCVACA